MKHLETFEEKHYPQIIQMHVQNNLVEHSKSVKNTDPCKRKEAKTEELNFAEDYLFLPIVFL